MKKKWIVALLALITALSCVIGLAACGGGKTKLKLIEVPLSEEQYAFAVNKGNTALLDQLNQVLVDKKTEIDEIISRLSAAFDPEEFTKLAKPVVSAAKDDSKNQLIVATNAAFPPFEAFDSGNTYLGIDMEIAQILAKSLGKELVISNMEFDSIEGAVTTNKADIGMAGLTVTPERQKTMDFSDTYFDATQYLIVRGDDTRFDNKTKEEIFEILAGVANGKVGVQKGTTGQQMVEGNADFGFDGFPNLKLQPFPTGANAVQALQNGSIDFVIIDKLPATSLVNAFNKN